jgi:peptide/nickel transport system ATP-binding protein
MSLLELRDLSLSINGQSILDRLNLEMAPGEITALTGESGSGKSLTALAVMGLLPKGAETSGKVLFGGQDLLNLPDTEMCRLRGQQIGMVFQEPMTALNPVQTIGQQVAETLRIHKRLAKGAAQRQAQLVLERVGLPANRFPPSRFPHELSGGQRQRVVIAMAIAMGPRLLIADEPTTALDVTTQAQILALLKKLAQEDGMGLLMITHDLAVVAQMADNIVVMRNGEIVEQGPTQRVLAQASHPYTQNLLRVSNHRVDLPPPPAPEPMLVVENAQRVYKLPQLRRWGAAPVFRAVDDVSFVLHHGERLGLVGESGCGKSTLTRAILGLEPLQGGRITLDGVPVTAGGRPLANVQRAMQVVFQDPFGSFNPRHRVERLICEPFHLLDNPPRGAERRKAIDQALEDVGLRSPDAGKYIHEFSGGQRQRIAIARALIIRPKLIIFDEAVSALDVSVRAQILDLLADLCRAYGLGYLFISHDLNVVRSITDRVMVMQAGRIVETGPTAQVLQNPQHTYTKALIAAVPRLPDNLLRKGNSHV